MGEESNFRCQPKYICPYQFIGCCGSCHHYPFRPVIPQDKNGEAYCMSFLTSSCMICVGFGLTSALLCIKIFFFPFSRTDSQTPNLSQYVLLISHMFTFIVLVSLSTRLYPSQIKSKSIVFPIGTTRSTPFIPEINNGIIFSFSPRNPIV